VGVKKRRYLRSFRAAALTSLFAGGCNLLTAVGDLRADADDVVDASQPPPPPDGAAPFRDVTLPPFPDVVLPDGFSFDQFTPEDAAAGDAGPRDGAGPLRVFITSTTVMGGFGGLSAADDFCAAAAAKANLGGSWRAWLSTNQVAAISRITSDGPWVNMVGDPIASNRAALASGMLTSEIRYDETGQNRVGTNNAFTGTSADGGSTGQNCSNWLFSFFNATVGHSQRTSPSWTDDSVQSCTSARRIYCFEN
jgi:hypothetical protein